MQFTSTEGATMSGTKITSLTAMNVAAIREISPRLERTAIAVETTTTTATFHADNARQVLAAVQTIMGDLPTKGHPRASLHAVVRKLRKQADAEVAASFDTDHVDEVLAQELSSLDLDAAVTAAADAEQTQQERRQAALDGEFGNRSIEELRAAPVDIRGTRYDSQGGFHRTCFSSVRERDAYIEARELIACGPDDVDESAGQAELAETRTDLDDEGLGGLVDEIKSVTDTNPETSYSISSADGLLLLVNLTREAALEIQNSGTYPPGGETPGRCFALPSRIAKMAADLRSEAYEAAKVKARQQMVARMATQMIRCYDEAEADRGTTFLVPEPSAPIQTQDDVNAAIRELWADVTRDFPNATTPLVARRVADELAVPVSRVLDAFPSSSSLRGSDYTTGSDRDEAPRDAYTGQELEL